MDCSPTGSSVHGTSQARILEWVAIYFSRGSPWPRDRTCISYIGRPILYHWATWEAQKLSLEDVEKNILLGFWGHNSLWYKNTFQFNHRDRWQKKKSQSSFLLISVSFDLWLALANEMLAEMMHMLEMDSQTEVSFSLCLCHHHETMPQLAHWRVKDKSKLGPPGIPDEAIKD